MGCRHAQSDQAIMRNAVCKPRREHQEEPVLLNPRPRTSSCQQMPAVYPPLCGILFQPPTLAMPPGPQPRLAAVVDSVVGTPNPSSHTKDMFSQLLTAPAMDSVLSSRSPKTVPCRRLLPASHYAMQRRCLSPESLAHLFQFTTALSFTSAPNLHEKHSNSSPRASSYAPSCPYIPHGCEPRPL